MTAARRPAPAEMTPVTLESLRAGIRRARDLDREVEDLEQRLGEKKAERHHHVHEVLPDVFAQAQVLAWTLEPEGNLPAYEAKVGPYYRANIAADWEPERRDAGFALLEERGAGDIIKHTITVSLGRGQEAVAKKVMAGLDKAKVAYEVGRVVPWNTLTAWLREQVEKKHDIPPLAPIGGEVGRRVNIKQVGG